LISSVLRTWAVLIDRSGGDKPVKGIRAAHYFLFDLQDVNIYPRFSESKEEIKVKGQSYPTVKIESLLYGALISDKRAYVPGDTVRLLVASPGGAGVHASLEVTFEGQRTILADEFILDDYGVYLYELKGLEESGTYTATIVTNVTPPHKEVQADRKVFSCDFAVTRRTLNPLSVQLKRLTISGDSLDAVIVVTVLNQPYAGSIRIRFYCDYCRQIINEMSAEARKGLFYLKIGLRTHTGPFRLEFTTADGNTASLTLQSIGAEQQREIQVGNLGEVVNVAPTPMPDGRNLRGIYRASRGVSATPIIVKGGVSDKVRLQATSALDYACMYAFNPLTKKVKQWSKKRVKEDDEFLFDNSAPYEIILVGCIINAKEETVFEGRTVVFYPEELEVKLSTPPKAQPNEEVRVALETSKTAQCLLMVYDARLDTENLTSKLGNDLYTQIATLEAIEEPGTRYQQRREEAQFGKDATNLPSGVHAAHPVGSLGVQPEPKTAGRVMSALPPTPVMRLRADMSEASAARALASIVASEIPVQLVTAPRRALFPEILACKLIEVDRVHEELVKLGDTIGKWKVQVYAFADLDYISKSSEITADKTVAIDIDIPNMIEEGDEYYGKAIYHAAEGKARLLVKLPDGTTYEDEVEGDGIREFRLSRPGKVEAQLTSPSGVDSIMKSMDSQLSEKVTVSTLTSLEKGDELCIEAGKKLSIYNSMRPLISELAKALCQYPFECSEQTSAKLCGLAVAWESGERTKEAAQMIDAGLARMAKFLHPDALYSLWENAKLGTAEVTAKVLRNLAPIRRIDRFEEKVNPLIVKSLQELLRRDVLDNSLLSLSERFMAPISTVEDAANIATYREIRGGMRRGALEFIESKAIGEPSGDEVYWEPSRASWGGVLEATATCLRALHESSDENRRFLFKKGFKFVTKRLANSRLHSTADTRALIELFAAMKDVGARPRFSYQTYVKANPASPVIKTERDLTIGKSDVFIPIDDEVHTDISSPGRKLIARSQLFVRIDGTETVDYKKVRSTFDFDAKLDRMILKLGQRVKLTVTPRHESRCPVVRVFLAPNLISLEGEVNMQTISKPMVEGSIELDLLAASRGRSRLYVMLYDMYEPNMIGITIPIGITVTLP